MSGGVGQDGLLPFTEQTYIETPGSKESVRLFINKLDNLPYLKKSNGTVIAFPDNSANDKNYVLNQNVASSVWNVPHNLNKRCSVQVVDEFFNEIEAAIFWSDNNEVIVTFNSPRKGYVYCN
jgi:hypothetical protein